MTVLIRHLAAPAFLAAMALPAPSPAQGQTICGPRAQIVATLETRFGESVHSVGLADANRIVEVFASEETGSWTITVTSSNGVTCLMASGHYFEAIAAALPGEPT